MVVAYRKFPMDLGLGILVTLVDIVDTEHIASTSPLKNRNETTQNGG